MTIPKILTLLFVLVSFKVEAQNIYPVYVPPAKCSNGSCEETGCLPADYYDQNNRQVYLFVKTTYTQCDRHFMDGSKELHPCRNRIQEVVPEKQTDCNPKRADTSEN